MGPRKHSLLCHSVPIMRLLSIQRWWRSSSANSIQTSIPKQRLNPPHPSSNNSSTADVKVVHGSKIVINDILLYSTNIFTLIRYFSCVARFFVRHRLSFKLSKCKFFEPRVDCLGYDLTSSGNCPAKSKFNMITDWTLPVNGTPPLLFIGMCFFMRASPPGSKLILNHYTSCNVNIIGRIFQKNYGHLNS